MDRGDTIRVLHITEMLSAAGIESFIMNMYRRIDRSLVQFDFLVLRNEKEFYDTEIKELGGIKYWVHSDINNTLLRIFDEARQIEVFLKEHHYDIVHIHYTTPLRAPYLKAALNAGVKIRIYHAHSAFVSGKSKIKLAIYSYMRKKITQWGTHYFACSQAAAEWIYERKLIEGNKTKVIYNGIDTSRFKLDLESRSAVRQEYGLEDKYVLIHTGRFTLQKNQTFLVSLLKKLKEIVPNAVLLFLGDGEMINTVKENVKANELTSSVYFMGVKSDVYRYLSAADCYVMPSLYEGLPVAGIEAECSGLPCIFSSHVTQEVALTDQVVFLPLEDPEKWIKQLVEFKNRNRVDQSNIVKDKGYDMQGVANNMQQFYLECSFRQGELK